MTDVSNQTPRRDESALDVVRKCMLALPAELDELDIQLETRFVELDLDSLDLLELLVMIDDRYGVYLPDEYLGAATVGEIVEALGSGTDGLRTAREPTRSSGYHVA